MKNKKINFKFGALLLVLASVFYLSSCKDEPQDNTPQPTKSMIEILGEAKFSIFKSALDKANMTSTFTGSTKYTVFIPTDDVMVAAGIPNVDGISESDLANFIRYHMLEGAQTATTLPAYGYVSTLNAQGPVGLKLKLNVRVNAGVIAVNNAQVLNTNIGTNGVIHEVSKVLKQPTIYDMLSYSPELAKYKTGLDFETNLKDMCKDLTGLSTVFAPNNAGTDAYITLKNRQFSSMAPADRRAFLNNGFVENSLKLTAGLTSGNLTTLGDPIAVSMVSGKITLNDEATIVIGDIVCLNGVIHMIDKALAK